MDPVDPDPQFYLAKNFPCFPELCIYRMLHSGKVKIFVNKFNSFFVRYLVITIAKIVGLAYHSLT